MGVISVVLMYLIGRHLCKLISIEIYLDLENRLVGFSLILLIKTLMNTEEKAINSTLVDDIKI